MDGSGGADGADVLNLKPVHLWKALLLNMMCSRLADDDSASVPLTHLFNAECVDVYLMQSLEREKDTILEQLLADLDEINFSLPFAKELCRTCSGFVNGHCDIHSLNVIMDDLDNLLVAKGPREPALLHPLSLFGMYLRDVLAAYKSLSFENGCQFMMLCQNEFNSCHHASLVEAQQICLSALPTPLTTDGEMRVRASTTCPVAYGSSPVLVHSEVHCDEQLGSSTGSGNGSGSVSMNPPLVSTPHRPVMLWPQQMATPVSRVAMPATATSASMSPGSGTSPSGGGGVTARLIRTPLPMNKSADLSADFNNTSAMDMPAVLFSLPDLDIPVASSRRSSQAHCAGKAQKVSEELFLANQRLDWNLLVKLHHDLFDSSLPPSELATAASSSCSVESIRKAYQHCGNAIKELSVAATSFGYKKESAMLRNKAVQVALTTDDKDSQFWALSDVLDSIQPASTEATVFAQQLQSKAETSGEGAMHHLPHMWKAWHSMFKCNKPMHLITDECTQSLATVLENQNFPSLRQLLSFWSAIYQTLGYSCCSQLLSQVLMLFSPDEQPPCEPLVAESRTTHDRILHIRQVVFHMVSAAQWQGDLDNSIKLLEYDDLCEQLATWPVQLCERLSVQRCEVWIERSLVMGNWHEAKKWINALRAHSTQMTSFYEAKLMFALGDTSQARHIVTKLLTLLETSFAQTGSMEGGFVPQLLAKSLLLLAEILLSKSILNCNLRQVLDKALSLCKLFNMTTCQHEVLLTMVDMQLQCPHVKPTADSKTSAYQTLLPWLPQILACSPLFDQGRALLLFARTVMAEQRDGTTAQDTQKLSYLLLDCEKALEKCCAKTLLSRVQQCKAQLNASCAENSQTNGQAMMS